jgi:hypothetical protein
MGNFHLQASSLRFFPNDIVAVRGMGETTCHSRSTPIGTGYIYYIIQSVLGGMVNILGGGGFDYSE